MTTTTMNSTTHMTATATATAVISVMLTSDSAVVVNVISVRKEQLRSGHFKVHALSIIPAIVDRY